MTRPVSMRQLVEGMALGFDASLGSDPAVVELTFVGEERGTYQLIIADGHCRFERGPLEPPTLRVETEAAVWRAVAENLLDPTTAILDGRMKVSGDLGLFQRLPRLFRKVKPEELRAPAAQRPPGPLRLPAMAWLLVALLPWKAVWMLTAAWGSGRAVLTGFVIAVVIWGSREARGGATFGERSTALVFAAAGAGVAAGAAPPPGLVGASFLALAAIWAASVLHARYPLTAEYSRWNYVPRLWSTGLFRHPNVLLTLLWSGIFVALGVLEAAGARGWIAQRAAGGASVALCVAGALFTRRHERGARLRRIDDLDESLACFQRIARLLLGIAAAGFLLVGHPRPPSGWLLIPAALALAALWRRPRPQPGDGGPSVPTNAAAANVLSR
ncbi:SCP2 sterol-binding domain-containing protein [Anaeromyxobacter terrae]|uniref:SCP2 sterol-binding domain-containing protein n=1 Tax=Anaeromyxobacter terrae TaxID=2925406 RepID=UPI001F56B704|nr:SCP2 sterol-binding domain-containing protein [Anaeromyxobacter sp. SG22]